ncbi:unnamed protein product [Mytilus coruscus]|uniref:THAP-type domain-containing protein n=1 Tax=Mytilus coruscus TaxID=42192 RepID=A0A6J8DZ88_MYTCO|nr:unnamed protein product [Mytilus coruscus]
MPSTCCSVPRCSNCGGYVFPKDEKLKKKWIKAIRRNSDKNKYWKPSKSSVVCRFHFKPTDFISETSREKIEDSESNLQNNQTATSQNPVTDSDSQTQTWPALCVEKFEDDPAGMKFYTGLQSHYDFTFVLASLGEAAYKLYYIYFRSERLSVENQFFLTLVKLRQHKTNFELSRLFNISETAVINIWITWINFMFHQWKEINIWPERDLVRFFSPYNFRRQFPTTRIIIDGTECPIRKPRSPIAQQSTFSTYKNRNTIKILVGATPGGLVSYVSPSYGGSSSDRQICESSRLMTICDHGDSIMADKGFNVQDLFAPYDVSINIPTFFRKKNRMTCKSVMKDRKISSKRVHIERIKWLAKTFKILKEPLNIVETKLATDITFVCFMLCNFKNCIIPGNA